MEYTQLKSALAANIHARTIAERDYHQAQAEADKWEKRYQLSLEAGREDLVREARFRKDVFVKTACNLEALLNEQTERLATLRRDLAAHSKKSTNKSSTNSGSKHLETRSLAMAEFPGSDLGTRLLKVERELEAMKDQLLHQQAGIGKLLKQNSTVLEDVKTLLVEASSEPNSTELKTQWASIESDDNDIDDDLAALGIRVCYSATSQNQAQLPTADTVSQIAELDDLEILLSQLDKL